MPEQQPAFVGGHPVLDFVNTVAWRTDATRRTDRVTCGTEGTDGWCRWAQDAGLRSAPVGPGESPVGPGESRDELLRLRDALGSVLDAHAEGSPLPPEAWNDFRRAVLAARAAAELPVGLPMRWRPPASSLVHQLALLAEELLSDPAQLTRLGRCAGPGCGWFYLDRTRSRTRRWCSSGDCGNRDRARRHYARTRQPVRDEG